MYIVPTYSARNLIVFSTFLFIFADSCNDSPKILYRGQNSQGKVLRLLLSVGDIHKGSQEGYNYTLANTVSVKLDPPIGYQQTKPIYQFYTLDLSIFQYIFIHKNILECIQDHLYATLNVYMSEVVAFS